MNYALLAFALLLSVPIVLLVLRAIAKTEKKAAQADIPNLADYQHQTTVESHLILIKTDQYKSSPFQSMHQMDYLIALDETYPPEVITMIATKVPVQPIGDRHFVPGVMLSKSDLTEEKIFGHFERKVAEVKEAALC